MNQDIILQCGELVKSAESLENQANYDALSLSNTCVIKTIYVDENANDVSNIIQSFRSIGFISIGKDNTAFIIFRGTSGNKEWIQDFKSWPTSTSDGGEEDGFHDLYHALSFTTSASTTFINDLGTFLKDFTTIYISGHSLGGALAVLLAYDLSKRQGIHLVTFAAPKVGDSTFIKNLTNAKLDAIMYAYALDLVPRLPPVYAEYPYICKLPEQADICQTVQCSHSLKTYLHILDPKNHSLDSSCIIKKG
jgi:predicted lipase